MSKKRITTKRIVKMVAILLMIFLIGGIGGVYFDQKVLPFIRTNKHLSRINFLKRSAENITVINKTEQVTIKEDDSINEIASNASNSVVNIISLSSKKDLISKQSKEIDQSGSGVIVSSDGMIVTYRSAIIEKDATYKILLLNGNAYDAKLVGVDEFTNLAFLRVDAQNLPVISFADSKNVRPGKKVVAIGNASGEYQNRYAAGLLSNFAKTFNLAGKAFSTAEKMEGVFETDFNNQGEYVGGPVIGYSGDLVGIIGMVTIDGQDKYFQVPSNMVDLSLKVAMDDKLSSRPFLGAYHISITKEYSIARSLKRDRGALVFSPSGKQGLAIIAESPAEKVGLKINDIIIAVNGKEINLDNPLSNLINENKKGDSVELTIERDGKEIKISLQL